MISTVKSEGFTIPYFEQSSKLWIIQFFLQYLSEINSPSLSRGLLKASRVVGLALLAELSRLSAVLNAQRPNLIVPRRRQLEPAPRVHLPIQL